MKGLPTYGEALDRSEIHEILRNDRRRATVEVLREKMGSVSLRDLSEAIAEREAETATPSTNLRKSVYNSLHQTHLPKLDERGIIDYDRDRKTVRLEEGAREVYVHMEVVNRHGITWADYYRTLGVLALMAIVAGELGVPGLSNLGALAIGTVFLLVFAISTGRQLWVNRWLYLRSLLPSN